MDAAGFQVVEDDLRRAEEVRVDGVEIVIVTLEDRSEWLAIVARGEKTALIEA